MTAREQAEQLRRQAIQTLLEEKDAIDKMLQSLSYSENMSGVKRWARWVKQQEDQESSPADSKVDDPSNSETSKQVMPIPAQIER